MNSAANHSEWFDPIVLARPLMDQVGRLTTLTEVERVFAGWPYPGEVLLARILSYTGFVDNGGFGYLFTTRSAHREVPALRSALIALGAVRHAELLQRAWDNRNDHADIMMPFFHEYFRLQEGVEDVIACAAAYYLEHRGEFRA